MQTNLPPINKIDSAEQTKLFFDEYGKDPLEFNSNEVTAAIGFFQSKGFDTDAAEVTASVILKQAKLENIPVFTLLDNLKRVDSATLTAITAEILNNNRPSSSSLGFKAANAGEDFKTRNILA